MDATDAHRFRVLMNLRKEYRELHQAARAVIDAWNNGAYDYRGRGDDPIMGLKSAFRGRSGTATDAGS